MNESASGCSFVNGLLTKPGSLWFETAGPGVGGGEALLFTDPVEELQLRSVSDLYDYFSELECRHAAGFFLAGWIGYEAGYGFESGTIGSYCRGMNETFAWFGVYREPRRFFGKEVELFLAGEDDRAFSLPERMRFSYEKQEYADLVAVIKDRLAAGDVYQVNLTGRFRFPFTGSPSAFFRKLRRSQPAAYTAYLNTGDRTVLSLSPELFFRCSGGFIETKPMKGTAPRGATQEDDARNLHELASCEKNRAENLMIVDLLRNDLGRICVPGSVVAEDMFVVETYPTLYQMVSSVKGKLRDDALLYDIFRALYPSGSVTGAPKVRAMELIRRLEPSSRGIYTGAIGFVQPGRDMVFSVAIRTVELIDGKGVYGSGSGIVWDSDPMQEYGECLLKASILTGASGLRSGLFESMLWNGRLLWVSEHLERLRASASLLSMPFDLERAQISLMELDRELSILGGRFKVRLTLLHDGSLYITHETLQVSTSPAPLRLCLAGERIVSADMLRYHKTTARELYDGYYRTAKARGFDDVLFLNERGEIAETAIANVIIRKEGRYFTPPVSTGLLAGIYRSYFLKIHSDCSESTLYPCDLCAADAIYLCNSVRGIRLAVYEGVVLSGNS